MRGTRPSKSQQPYAWHGHLQPIRSQCEVAAMLNCSYKTVASHESRALAKLRGIIEILEEYGALGTALGKGYLPRKDIRNDR